MLFMLSTTVRLFSYIFQFKKPSKPYECICLVLDLWKVVGNTESITQIGSACHLCHLCTCLVWRFYDHRSNNSNDQKCSPSEQVPPKKRLKKLSSSKLEIKSTLWRCTVKCIRKPISKNCRHFMPMVTMINLRVTGVVLMDPKQGEFKHNWGTAEKLYKSEAVGLISGGCQLSMRDTPKQTMIWWYMGVSKNNGTPKSSILIGFSIINHPFWGTLTFGNTHISFCFSI